MEMYNGDLSCVAMWGETDKVLKSTTDLQAVGARIDEFTFESSADEIIFSCVVWGEVVPESVTWSNSDGDDIAAQDNKVCVLYLQKHSFIYTSHRRVE